MNITTTFTSNPRLVMRSYRACHWPAYVARWVVCLEVILVGVWLNSILLIAMGVLIVVVMELSVRRQLAAFLSGVHEVTVTMTDSEYRTSTGDRATARTWSTFSKVHARGGFWVLRVSSQAALSLPKAALDDDQTATFVAAMRAKGLLTTR